MDQRSDKWHDARLGRFTASEIYKLMGMKGIGEIGNTYAFEKAVEVVFGKDKEESFVSYDMQRGIELEPLAFRKFQEIKEPDFLSVEKCTFFPFGDNAGASPDGLVGKDAILEIKCPKPNKFFSIVANGYGDIYSKYICQMQMQMLCTKSEQCHFFNYIIFNSVEMWHEIIVKRDVAIQDLLIKRIEEAVIIRDKYIEELGKNKQF